MRSQWDNFLQNLGEWQGFFIQISPTGEILEETPSVLFLEGFEDNQKVRLTLRRTNSQKLVREYLTLGRDILFFENGAFSQGSIQLAPFSEFGAEFGLIASDSPEGDRNPSRRLRFVQLFNRDGELSKFTLIREKRAGTNAVERPQLTVEQLLGEWQGEAVTLYPDLRSPDTYPTTLNLQYSGTDRIIQQLTFGSGANIKTHTSTGLINGQIILFDQGSLPVQVWLLPDGASATARLKVQLRQAFFLEVGWLIQPSLRQRLIRSYNDKGEWVSLTLVTERKVIGNG